MRTRLAALITILTILTACTGFRFPVSPTTTVAVALLGGAQNVRLFVYPDDDEHALLNKIAAARHRVLMKMYLLTDARIIGALVTAQQNGAVVQAMVEEHPFGGGATVGQAYDKLKAAGITTRYTNPAFRFTHEKSFVIDDDAVILTANMTKSAFAHNRELGVITTNPNDVAQMVASFQADWNRTAFKPTSPDLVWSPDNARMRINRVINSATRQLIVYAEEAQDDEQTQLLVNAVARGVDVRFIISPPSSTDGSVGSDGNALDLDRMQSGGVSVRYLKNPYIHAKMFVADNVLGFVGSQNISTGSLDFNRELGILVSDPTALERLTATFDTDWDKAIDR